MLPPRWDYEWQACGILDIDFSQRMSILEERAKKTDHAVEKNYALASKPWSEMRGLVWWGGGKVYVPLVGGMQSARQR